MQVDLNGSEIRCFDDFVSAMATALSVDYFGWDLHSLHDCLQGGYGGEPPYEIVVSEAETMLEAFGHVGLEQYETWALQVIAEGGRGMLRTDDAAWHRRALLHARGSVGDTLLETLARVVCGSPASLQLRGRNGQVLFDSTTSRRKRIRPPGLYLELPDAYQRPPIRITEPADWMGVLELDESIWNDPNGTGTVSLQWWEEYSIDESVLAASLSIRRHPERRFAVSFIDGSHPFGHEKRWVAVAAAPDQRVTLRCFESFETETLPMALFVRPEVVLRAMVCFRDARDRWPGVAWLERTVPWAGGTEEDAAIVRAIANHEAALRRRAEVACEPPVQRIEIDGASIASFDDFVSAIAGALSVEHLGWDLRSFGACLEAERGEPPYEIVVGNAERMQTAFGHEGMQAYAAQQLEAVAAQDPQPRTDRARLEGAARLANEGRGPTLLVRMAEILRASRASVRLVGSDGRPLVDIAEFMETDWPEGVSSGGMFSAIERYCALGEMQVQLLQYTASHRQAWFGLRPTGGAPAATIAATEVTELVSKTAGRCHTSVRSEEQHHIVFEGYDGDACVFRVTARIMNIVGSGFLGSPAGADLLEILDPDWAL